MLSRRGKLSFRIIALARTLRSAHFDAIDLDRYLNDFFYLQCLLQCLMLEFMYV